MLLEEYAITDAPIMEEDVQAAANHIRAIVEGGAVRESLNIISENGFYLNKQIRNLKMHRRYREHQNRCTTIVPEILLKGNWLQRAGFEPGEYAWVLPFEGLLIIIPEAKRYSSS
jgi:hypothetical protein